MIAPEPPPLLHRLLQSSDNNSAVKVNAKYGQDSRYVDLAVRSSNQQQLFFGMGGGGRAALKGVWTSKGRPWACDSELVAALARSWRAPQPGSVVQAAAAASTAP